jgi:hypothetical protein
VSLAADLQRIAAAASLHAGAGEEVAGVLAAEPAPSERTYLCAFGADGDDARTWLALDDECAVVTSRDRVRDAVSIAALCEIASESAFAGDLDELRAELVQLRLTESPPGIAEAEEAAAALQRTLGAPPHLATPAHLDAIGAATRRLEASLFDPGEGSPFATRMRGAHAAVDELWREVEAAYRVPWAEPEPSDPSPSPRVAESESDRIA